MQNRAASHGDLLRQKWVIENGSHRQAEQQILLDLVKLGSLHRFLMHQNILQGQSDQLNSPFSPTLSSTRQGKFTHAPGEGMPGCKGTMDTLGGKLS